MDKKLLESQLANIITNITLAKIKSTEKDVISILSNVRGTAESALEDLKRSCITGEIYAPTYGGCNKCYGRGVSACSCGFPGIPGDR